MARFETPVHSIRPKPLSDLYLCVGGGVEAMTVTVSRPSLQNR